MLPSAAQAAPALPHGSPPRDSLSSSRHVSTHERALTRAVARTSVAAERYQSRARLGERVDGVLAVDEEPYRGGGALDAFVQCAETKPVRCVCVCVCVCVWQPSWVSARGHQSCGIGRTGTVGEVLEEHVGELVQLGIVRKACQRFHGLQRSTDLHHVLLILVWPTCREPHLFRQYTNSDRETRY